MIPSSPLEWVTVRTTLPVSPLPPLESRTEIKTKRLVLRRTLKSDLGAWHALRLQPEVMQWTKQGKPDPSLEWSEERLQMRLAPEASGRFEFVVCLADTGEMIGVAGSQTLAGELGWPDVGYMLRKEFWGKGYATELVVAFLTAWWALPRTEVVANVDKSTVVRGADGKVLECIVAVTTDSNGPSQRVLNKAKLELVKVWQEADGQEDNRAETLFGFVTRTPAG